jgi:hypothetical protein
MGINDYVGSLEPGKLADLWFGIRGLRRQSQKWYSSAARLFFLIQETSMPH